MKQAASRRVRGSARPGTGNSGAAYVLALVTLLVGMTLALAMIRSSGASFYAEDSRAKKRAAVNLAEAGADYAYWQVRWKFQRLPYSADVSLGSGSFHVDATDDGNNKLCAMKVVSTATAGRHTYALKREMPGMLPYDYCWCENQGVDDGDVLLVPSSPRGIRSNGSIKLSNSSTSITSGGWANTTFSGSGVVSPKYPYSPKIGFPSIDFGYFSSIATVTYGASWWTANVSLTQSDFSGTGGVIFVWGNITSMGNIVYNGTWIVVATHDITINCPITAANSKSYLAILAGHNTNIYTSASSAPDNLEAVVYNPYNDLNLRGTHYGSGPIRDNSLTIKGSLAADNLSTSGDGANLVVTINWDTRLTPTVMRDQLRLPAL